MQRILFVKLAIKAEYYYDGSIDIFIHLKTSLLALLDINQEFTQCPACIHGGTVLMFRETAHVLIMCISCSPAVSEPWGGGSVNNVHMSAQEIQSPPPPTSQHRGPAAVLSLKSECSNYIGYL